MLPTNNYPSMLPKARVEWSVRLSSIFSIPHTMCSISFLRLFRCPRTHPVLFGEDNILTTVPTASAMKTMFVQSLSRLDYRSIVMLYTTLLASTSISFNRPVLEYPRWFRSLFCSLVRPHHECVYCLQRRQNALALRVAPLWSKVSSYIVSNSSTALFETYMEDRRSSVFCPMSPARQDNQERSRSPGFG